MSDPHSFLGPYRLLDPLGQGGMGVVYRAEHCETGQQAAIKTVRVPQRRLVAGIRREIHALARLDHPGIVSILDDGFERGLPWYAMELVEGRPLATARAGGGVWWTERLASTAGGGRCSSPDPWREPTGAGRPAAGQEATRAVAAPEDGSGRAAGGRRRRARGRPLSASGALEPQLTLVRRLCSALAYLHGEGLVHRDLKPANIIVRPDGTPVVVDFGLTARFGHEHGREALEVEGATMGTAAYMAPEQVRGELVDARADLYALGCILYELVTGRAPFAAATAHALFLKHLTAVPLAPSALVDGVPPQLDDLVLRLLEKRPERRLGHADDVAAALVRLGAEEAMPHPVPQPRAYLYRPHLCGRRGEIERLEAPLAGLREGSGGVLLVGGESGVGKTRLVVEVGRRAARDGALVLSGECLPSPAKPALMPLRRPLRETCDLCHEEGLETAERIFGRRGKVLSLYEPAIAALPGQEAHPAPRELPADAAVERLFDALGESLAALAAARPVLVILDDLQWADELTLDFLSFAARRRLFERRPVLVVGTYRTEEVAAEASGGPPLLALLERPEPGRLDLGRLDEAAVEAMVGDMLALDPPPRGFGKFLSRQSEGNPFFVAEYLRASVAERVLFRGEGGVWRVAERERPAGGAGGPRSPGLASWEALALPQSVRELVARRLEGLGPEERKAAEAGAVLGREMEASLLGRVARLGRDRTMECVHELLRRQVLEEPQPGVVRFVHDKVREVAYERLAAPRRRRLHRAAARELERRGAVESAAGHTALGTHWEGAGEPVTARGHYLEAARLLAARYAYAQAESLYRRYLALADRPSREGVEARSELATKVLTVSGKNGEALGEQLAALEEARELEDRRLEGRALQEAASAYRALGRIDECRRLGEEALAVLRETGDAGGEGKMLALLGIVLHFHEGRLAEAEPLYESALVLLRRAGDRRTEGVTLANLGELLRHRGDYAGARRVITEGVEVLRSIGDRAAEGAAMSQLVAVSGSEGRFDEAVSLCREALAVCRDAGFRRFEGINLSALGYYSVRRGRLAEARSFLDEALEIHREIGHRRFEGITLAHLGDCHYARGEVERARATYERALEVHREVGNREFEGETLAALARWHLERGGLDEARALNAEALEIHREIGDRRYEGLTTLRMASVERLEGRLDEAGALLERAEETFARLGEGLLVATGLCERGHWSLAMGLPAAESLSRAEELVRAAAAGPESDAARAVGSLRRAIRARDDAPDAGGTTRKPQTNADARGSDTSS